MSRWRERRDRARGRGGDVFTPEERKGAIAMLEALDRAAERFGGVLPRAVVQQLLREQRAREAGAGDRRPGPQRIGAVLADLGARDLLDEGDR